MTQQKPSLTAVLEHYQVAYTPSRTTQMVRCPLHDDHTPSCSIDTDRGLFNCHACGKGGDVYTLIMQKESIGFVRARALATTLNLAARSAGGSDEQLSGSLYGGRRPVPTRPGHRPTGGGYAPAWRRR